MRSLQHYIETEARCVDDLIEVKSIYQTKVERQDAETADIEKWENLLHDATVRLKLARMQLKSYLETHILTD